MIRGITTGRRVEKCPGLRTDLTIGDNATVLLEGHNGATKLFVEFRRVERAGKVAQLPQHLFGRKHCRAHTADAEHRPIGDPGYGIVEEEAHTRRVLEHLDIEAGDGIHPHVPAHFRFEVADEYDFANVWTLWSENAERPTVGLDDIVATEEGAAGGEEVDPQIELAGHFDFVTGTGRAGCDAGVANVIRGDSAFTEVPGEDVCIVGVVARCVHLEQGAGRIAGGRSAHIGGLPLERNDGLPDGGLFAGWR
ncbi:MAG: hypothetical protein R3C29_00960 [Dehalococcoidia bacterium]